MKELHNWFFQKKLKHFARRFATFDQDCKRIFGKHEGLNKSIPLKPCVEVWIFLVQNLITCLMRVRSTWWDLKVFIENIESFLINFLLYLIFEQDLWHLFNKSSAISMSVNGKDHQRINRTQVPLRCVNLFKHCYFSPRWKIITCIWYVYQLQKDKVVCFSFSLSFFYCFLFSIWIFGVNLSF